MHLIDFAIVTALPEELQAIKKAFPEFHEVSDNSSTWYRTIVESRDKQRKYHILAALQTQMGPLDALELTKNIINTWNPAYIILSGIAGSFHESVKLGDVIISQQVFHFDPGKAVDKGRNTGIEYRPQGYPCSITLIRQAEAVSMHADTWKNSVIKSAKSKANKLRRSNPSKNKKLIAELESYQPKVHFGTVASGSLVVASTKKKQELLRLHGRIIGTEMEGAGVLHAAYYEETSVAAIVIKAISDGANSEKNAVDKSGVWREMANEDAAKFVLLLISSGKFRSANTNEFHLSTRPGSPGEARALIKDAVAPGNGSFLAFPELIIPRGAITDLQITVTTTGRSGVLKVDTMVVKYTDLKGGPRTDIINNNVFRVAEPIAPASIGIYLLLTGGEVQSIHFNVSAFGIQKEETWTPNH